jgi:hypothetical protein
VRAAQTELIPDHARALSGSSSVARTNDEIAPPGVAKHEELMEAEDRETVRLGIDGSRAPPRRRQ